MERQPHLRVRGPFIPPLDQVVQYPEAPGYVVFTLPSPKRVRVKAMGEWIADSVDAIMLFESDHIPIYYFPIRDVRMDLFEPGTRRTHSPWKGFATHRSLRGGGERYADVMWHYEDPVPQCPDISGHVSFYWHHVDEWWEEDEQVFVHARDPFRRVDCLPTSREVVVTLDGEVVARSRRAVLLFETGLPTRPYLPMEDVRPGILSPSSRETQCPYKGTANYWDATTLAGRHEELVWGYMDPVREAAPIKGLVCFAGEFVDGVSIGGRPEPRPVTAFGSGYNYHGYKD